MEKSKNTLLSCVVKSIVFILILALLLLGLSYMMAPKDNTKESGIINPNATGFYFEPQNSIDVVVVGNSDAYSGFSPMELWNSFGYTSYVSAEGLQVPAGSLAMLKRILTCQTPKLVILETDGMFTKTDASQNIINAFNSVLGEPFSVFRYHNRWKKLKWKDVLRKPYYTAHCVTKGQMLSNKVKEYSGKEYMIETDEKDKIPPFSVMTVDKIKELCEENGIELLLLEMPSESSWNYKRHNAVKEFAKERDLPFIDLNLDRDRFDFDWTTDSRDGGNHLNTRGARKVTRFIGEYLQKHYDLPDYREDPAYSVWHEDYKEYLKQIKI